MSERNINEYSQTDWQKLAAMTDDEIDYTDIPPLDDHFFDRATLRVPDQPEVEIALTGVVEEGVLQLSLAEPTNLPLQVHDNEILINNLRLVIQLHPQPN